MLKTCSTVLYRCCVFVHLAELIIEYGEFFLSEKENPQPFCKIYHSCQLLQIFSHYYKFCQELRKYELLFKNKAHDKVPFYEHLGKITYNDRKNQNRYPD